MILTVTPAPAIDRTLGLDSFEIGAVNRITSSLDEPSGKGVNVSLALHRAGIPTTAVLPVGGASGEVMAQELTTLGVDTALVSTAADVRINITLVVPGQSGTKINAPGAMLDAGERARFLDAITGAVGRATAVLSCGSLPPGAGDGFHGEVAAIARGAGVFSVVDASGEPLRVALADKPDLIKPNVHELAELIGRPLSTLGDVIDAADEAIALGAGSVLASLGADGTMLVDAEGALHASATDIPVVNTVGAGDALLAGFIAGRYRGEDRAGQLATAVLWATSAVAHASTLFPVRPEFASRIAVTADVDRAQELGESSAALA